MRYTVKTIASAPEAMEQSKAYFGRVAPGLTITSQHKRALRWQGGSGYVSLIVKSDAPTLIEIETRGWEEAVQQFIAQLPQERSWWSRLWGRKKATVPNSSGRTQVAGS